MFGVVQINTRNFFRRKEGIRHQPINDMGSCNPIHFSSYETILFFPHLLDEKKGLDTNQSTTWEVATLFTSQVMKQSCFFPIY